jgi:hypothetical protein
VLISVDDEPNALDAASTEAASTDAAPTAAPTAASTDAKMSVAETTRSLLV